MLKLCASIIPLSARTFPGSTGASWPRSCQECLAALVDGNRLEMAERIAHEIDCRILLRQCPCAFGGEDDRDGVEQYRRSARQLSLSREHRAIVQLRASHSRGDDLHG